MNKLVIVLFFNIKNGDGKRENERESSHRNGEKRLKIDLEKMKTMNNMF